MHLGRNEARGADTLGQDCEGLDKFCHIWVRHVRSLEKFANVVLGQAAWGADICRRFSDNESPCSSPTPTANDPDLPFMDKFDISNPSYLDFTHEGVIAVMDSFINALPYQKGGAANGEAEKCDCSGIGKVVPTASLLSLLSFLVLLLSR